MTRLVLTACLASLSAPAQYVGNIVGTVRDASTGQPLAHAIVVVDAGRLQARTDAKGRFLIHSVPVEYPFSTYSVVASASGRRTQVLQNVRVFPGAVMALECAFSLGRTGTGFLPQAAFSYSHERTAPRASRAEAGKIFATREGLVGRTTANGHVIRASDRFVALPSRRALNPRGERKFMVRVRYGSKSTLVPVWDIGPWNIKDDYWNPSSQREMWKSLERGLPQAQAAYLEGHNGGKDGFGRKVMNPAGIDLSDAVFWHDLGMKDNGWVGVEYLWDPTLVSTREPERRRDTKRDQPRTLQDIIAIAEAILLRTKW